MQTINAYAATTENSALIPFQFSLPDLAAEQIDIKVKYCGICHSDLSMLANEWGITEYPFVPGHEIVGTVVAKGEQVKGINLGDEVGLGWFSESCLHCNYCLSGNQNLCSSAEATIVNRHGGFAEVVRCHWIWATKIPKGLDPSTLGPMFCGGITVFNPIVQNNVQPTDRVGVIGVGGLGHLAIQFLNKWGCEVTAFTSSAEKTDETRRMGAHHIVNSRNDSELEQLEGTFDFIINTTNANLNWELYLNALRPKGTLHTVGVVPDPIPVPSFPIILGQKSVSGSPLGSPATVKQMLEFCQRHNIAAITEEFAMSDVNAAFQHLKEGKARYRLVLKADF
jgi:uncharacterized zinc-type alcohol dehydrogenase-like protein